MVNFEFEKEYSNNEYVFVACSDDWYEPLYSYLWIEFEGKKKCEVYYYYDNDEQLNNFWEKFWSNPKELFESM